MITLSKKLSRVVSGPALNCLGGNLKLERKDVEAIAKILAENEETKPPTDRKRAINAFVQVAPADQSSQVLGKVLLDPQEGHRARLSAAAGLGKTMDDKSEMALIDALPKVEGRLRREVMKSLGRVGSEKGLAALAKAAEADDAGLKRQLAFAQTLIRHRTGDITVDPEVARRALGVEWHRRAVRQLAGAELRAHIDSLRGNTFGLKLSRDLGFEIQCGQTTNALLFGAQFGTGNPLDVLRSGPQLSALVVLPGAKGAPCSIRFVVLTSGSESGVEIMVTRTTGELVYSGKAKPDGDGLRLSVRDTGETAAPTDITGVISAKGLELEISSLDRRRVKVGQAI